jgi:hypothetical protein
VASTYFGGFVFKVIDQAAKYYGEYLTNTLSPTSLPSRERGSASLHRHAVAKEA